MTELKNAVVLLTGATGGFGQELTQLLLAAGSRVICTGTNAARLEQQAQQSHSSSSPGELLPSIVTDLTSAAGCEFLYQQVRSLNLPVDILINNAGIAVYGRLDEIPSDRWEQVMQLNLLAPMRLSSRWVPDMIARRHGHIVNISSVAGWTAFAGLTPYATSKFGLRGFSEGLRHEVKSFNVKVTAVYPFFSRTPILNVDRFGSFATGKQDLPSWLITDPRHIMLATIQGIQKNKADVFPDLPAQILSRLKRFAPGLVNWGSTQISQQISKQA
ncbi:SDR family NAD(P)-dependent oxidoreductase [Acaryochloris sp. IP29b_bin.148]|uniref:SDR family NAD(P)-dependent oxidoreductase n=1 Tax=Acaryochloris sp. IP29b_bin.148 TaxID=2969218 RepID=UPI002627D574|nr:SDR family NAD(P)-dependent oxidoreductase [Acaryochloris sp. IP29b_bin.148]